MNDVHIYKNGRVEIREPREYETPRVTELHHFGPGNGSTYVYWRIEVPRQRGHGVQVLVEV